MVDFAVVDLQVPIFITCLLPFEYFFRRGDLRKHFVSLFCTPMKSIILVSIFETLTCSEKVDDAVQNHSTSRVQEFSIHHSPKQRK